ncbi:hypothetical protein Adu01nite_91320 [Paractinoplanes durhamensis]|uniref:Uncharacterized protein n=1 Tax=Paractinoplanes durhamensis TaxID=113563 RepID=A0ABQ3ZD79_9ACTN|nr:hypothetical protein Adu01nite_91320 [Actinoplanes durhamensis]
MLGVQGVAEEQLPGERAEGAFSQLRDCLLAQIDRAALGAHGQHVARADITVLW